MKRVEALMNDLLAISPNDVEEDLLDSGMLDSLGLVELLHGIEQEFTIELPVDDLEVDRLRSVQSIADYVAELSPPLAG